MYQDRAGRLRFIESTVTRPATGLTGALSERHKRMAGVMRCRDTEMGVSVDIFHSPKAGDSSRPPDHRRHIRFYHNTEGVAAFHSRLKTGSPRRDRDERKIRRLRGRGRSAARLPEPDHPRPHGGARGPPGVPRLPAVRQQRGLRLPGEVQRHQGHLQVLRAPVRRPGQGRLEGPPGVRGARDAAPVQPDRVAAPRDPAAGLQPRHQRRAGRRVLRRRGVQPRDRARHPAPGRRGTCTGG